MNDRPLMRCGCVAQATDTSGKPVCVIHVGLTPDAEIPQAQEPDLEGRQAKCAYCRCTRPSSLDLPFFEHKPTWEQDAYYCGCRGWN